MKKYTFELFTSTVRKGLFTKEKQYYCRIRHRNGNILFVSEGYHNRTDVERMVYNFAAAIEQVDYQYNDMI